MRIVVACWLTHWLKIVAVHNMRVVVLGMIDTALVVCLLLINIIAVSI